MPPWLPEPVGPAEPASLGDTGALDAGGGETGAGAARELRATPALLIFDPRISPACRVERSPET